jgi:hypothetical protein
MRIFTVDEANEMLPEIVWKLKTIRRLYASVAELREQASAAAAASNFGGGMIGGTVYVQALYNIGKLTTEIHDAGVQLKDHTRGLIDFPTMRGGHMVLLCWELGEPERIEWWHEADAGFAGRQRL